MVSALPRLRVIKPSVYGNRPAAKRYRCWKGIKNGVSSVAFSSNGRYLASKSGDGTSSSASGVATLGRAWLSLEEPATDDWAPSLAFHPRLSMLATLGEEDTIIRIWELDEALLLGQAKRASTTPPPSSSWSAIWAWAKPGWAGGWRMASSRSTPPRTASSSGRSRSSASSATDGTECEAVLWDLAGQHVYRQIHSIFLENVAAALVLFDPSNRQEPLKGVQFWLEQLKGKGSCRPPCWSARECDRGAPALAQQELEQFCQRYGIRGGYISTSAHERRRAGDAAGHAQGADSVGAR